MTFLDRVAARSRSLGRIRRVLQPLKKMLYRELNITPMRRVIRELKRRNVDLHELDALEVFGGTGDYSVGACHMRDYRRDVATIEAWEIDWDHGRRLSANFPWVRVEIVDAHKKVLEPGNQFGFIVVDNPESTYAEYCEHFDLFPNILRAASDSAVLILNVMSESGTIYAKKYPDIFSIDHLNRRGRFYKTDSPENVPLSEMMKIYRELIESAGFQLEWYFWQDRNIPLDLLMGSVFPPMHYLVLKVKRCSVSGLVSGLESPTRAVSVRRETVMGRVFSGMTLGD